MGFCLFEFGGRPIAVSAGSSGPDVLSVDITELFVVIVAAPFVVAAAPSVRWRSLVDDLSGEPA